MGTSHSGAELGDKFDRLANLYRDQTHATQAGARLVQREVLTRLTAATGGDLRLSGFTRTTGVKQSGRRGRLGVVTKKVPTGQLVKVTGPAQLVESDVRKHFVFSRYARAQGMRSRTRTISSLEGGRISKQRVDTRSVAAMFGGSVNGGRRAVLNLGGGNYKRWTVAYSKGRKPFRHGVDAAEPKVALVMLKEEASKVAKVFG